MNEGKFGLYEAVCLTTLIIITKIFYTSIRAIIKTTGTAAWYATIISYMVSVAFFLLIYLLMKRFPGKNLVEIFEAVTGKLIGKFLAIIFSAYIIYYAAVNLREFVEMIKAYNLPYTPPSIILGVVIGAAVILAYKGLEGIARMGYFVFLPVLVGIIIILVLAFPYYNPRALFPILGYGLDTTLYFGVLRSSAYEEVVILAIMINSIQGLKNFKKAGLISLTISVVLFSTVLALQLMAFDYAEGSENLSGLFQLSRIIYFDRFFQRIESIFLFIWSISTIIAVSAAFYTSISVYCKAFKIKNHKPIILPFAYILFMVSLIPKNLSEVVNIHISFIRQYSFVIVYVIPVLVLVLSLILGRKGGKKKLEKA